MISPARPHARARRCSRTLSLLNSFSLRWASCADRRTSWTPEGVGKCCGAFMLPPGNGILAWITCFQCVTPEMKEESRSEEHTSELQSLMRISYAVFCLKKKIKKSRQTKPTQ